MKTTYANSARPKLIKWTCSILVAAGLVLIVLYLFELGDDLSFFYPLGLLLAEAGAFYAMYKLKVYEIDDAQDTLTDKDLKKYPLHISALTTATFKESKKGRHRSLFLHDSGNGFMDIRTSRETAEKMLARLLEINPAIEVKHAHYI
jgi:hypothetical protein